MSFRAELRSRAVEESSLPPTAKERNKHQPTAPDHPSILAQLENRPSRRTRITSLQHSAKAVAYLQEQCYSTLTEFQEEYKAAKRNTTAARKKVKEASKTIDALNAQLHYTGRYFANKKTYQTFLKSKNKGKYRKEHNIAITEYETARDWLKSRMQAGTLPSTKYLDTPEGKFPATGKLKTLRDEQVTQRNQYRSDYNKAKQKEREL